MKKQIYLALIGIIILGSLFAIPRLVYQIDPGPCVNCGHCVNPCPNDAIYYDTTIYNYQIDTDLCDGCGTCVNYCNRNAIHPVEVSSDDNEIQSIDEMISNYPNPFKNSTTISFALKNNNSDVSIEIYNLKGQMIEKLDVQNSQTEITWNADKLPSGTYFYKLRANGKFSSMKKMTLIK
jgi:ferredoxin